ncbi:GNAT family N-acetyltransferase [Veronia nyctiphanis]|uniref:GNAT family N-acetyltransferase n=1 Tax=Veronia nyctiphanis TaxID=1278244 RepID=A0A4Q0YQP4_9GAMM|nr:GNAT family N-acetyltransferase [Veronia nyctiphanis]RXJ72384.1 GNAT family N-acetyltransferase [Veronia nyctiphanis]
MNNLRFTPLNPIRFPLVARLYKSHYPAGKPKKDEVIWTAESENQLLASVRFKQFETFQLLTGMLVIPDFRGKGIGDELLNACNDQTSSKVCFCLAYRYLVPLYERNDFKMIETSELPDELAGRYKSYCNSGKDLVPMRFKQPDNKSESANASESVENC